MNKLLKKALPVGVLSCLLATNTVTSVLAAPTEIYGYKKMDKIEFHKINYDKYGNIREFPKGSIFKTTEEIKEEADGTSSASKHKVVIAPRRAKRSVEVVSGASNKGNDSESGDVDAVGGASGGFVGADVVFDFELLSNAMILHNLGVKNERVDKILDVWSKSTKTVVSKENTEEGYDWEDYVNKAADAYANGKDLTFEEYTKLKNAKKKKLPVKAKYVLEDGSYGSQVVKMEIGGKQAPQISNDNKNNKLGSDITFTYNQDEEWTGAIESITIGKEEYNKKPIDLNDVKFEGNNIVIDKKYFKLGENVITFSSKDYKTSVVTQFVYKDKIDLVAKEGKVGQDLVLEAVNKEYLKDIKFINLNGRVLDKEKGEWKVVNETLTLSKELFSVEGEYKILINTDNKYDLNLVNVKITKDSANTDKVNTESKVLPTIKSVEVDKYEDILLTFDVNKGWQQAITKIERVEKSGIVPLNKKLEFIVADGNITVPQKNDLKNPGDYVLRIFAEGYDPLDVTVTVVQEHPEVLITYIPRVNEEVKFKLQGDVYSWIDNLSEVFVNGKKLDKELYHTAGNLVVIHENVIITPGNHSVVMKSKGFTNAVKQIAVLEGKGATEETNLKDAPELNLKKAIVSKNEDVVVSVNDNEWIKELKIVQVNGTKVNDFVIKDKAITIASKYFNEGNNKIELLSPGYRKAFVDVEVAKAVPNDVRAFTSKEGFDVMIDLGYDRDYVVSEVILNGKTLQEKKDYEVSLSRRLTIDKSLVKAGSHEITLKADGYCDKNLTIEVKSDLNNNEGKEELKSPLLTVGLKNIKKGSKFNITKLDIDYMAESITFNGQEIAFTQEGRDIRTDISSLEAGDYEIVVKAKEYKDYKVNIKIEGGKTETTPDEIKEDTKPVETKPVELKNPNVNLWTSTVAKEGRLKLDNGDKNYIVDEITFNGQEVEFQQNDDKIIPDISSLDAGKYEIIVRAHGYKECKFNVTIYENKVTTKPVITLPESIEKEAKPVVTTPGETNPVVSEPIDEKLKSSLTSLLMKRVKKGSVLNINKMDIDYKAGSITIDGKQMTFEDGDRNIAVDISSLEVGTYEIILMADGYISDTFIFTII